MRARKYKRLTEKQKEIISILGKNKVPLREIAKLIGISHPAVYYQLKVANKNKEK